MGIAFGVRSLSNIPSAILRITQAIVVWQCECVCVCASVCVFIQSVSACLSVCLSVCLCVFVCVRCPQTKAAAAAAAAAAESVVSCFAWHLFALVRLHNSHSSVRAGRRQRSKGSAVLLCRLQRSIAQRAIAQPKRV